MSQEPPKISTVQFNEFRRTDQIINPVIDIIQEMFDAQINEFIEYSPFSQTKENKLLNNYNLAEKSDDDNIGNSENDEFNIELRNESAYISIDETEFQNMSQIHNINQNQEIKNYFDESKMFDTELQKGVLGNSYPINQNLTEKKISLGENLEEKYKFSKSKVNLENINEIFDNKEGNNLINLNNGNSKFNKADFLNKKEIVIIKNDFNEKPINAIYKTFEELLDEQLKNNENSFPKNIQPENKIEKPLKNYKKEFLKKKQGKISTSYKVKQSETSIIDKRAKVSIKTEAKNMSKKQSSFQKNRFENELSKIENDHSKNENEPSENESFEKHELKELSKNKNIQIFMKELTSAFGDKFSLAKQVNSDRQNSITSYSSKSNKNKNKYAEKIKSSLSNSSTEKIPLDKSFSSNDKDKLNFGPNQAYQINNYIQTESPENLEDSLLKNNEELIKPIKIPRNSTPIISNFEFDDENEWLPSKKTQVEKIVPPNIDINNQPSKLVQNYFCDQNAIKKENLKEEQDEKRKVDALRIEVEKKLNEKIGELQSEISNYKNKSDKLKIERVKFEDILKKFEKEKLEFEELKKSESEKFEEIKEEEFRKIKREKQIAQRNQKAMENKPNRKEREEIENLKEQLKTLDEESTKRERKMKINNERLKKKSEEQQIEIEELKAQISTYEKLRQHESEKTNEISLQKNKSKSSSFSTANNFEKKDSQNYEKPSINKSNTVQERNKTRFFISS